MRVFFFIFSILIIGQTCNGQGICMCFPSECLNHKNLSYSDFKKEIHIDTVYWHYAYGSYDSFIQHVDKLIYRSEYFDSISEQNISHVAESCISIMDEYYCSKDSISYNIYSCFNSSQSYMAIKNENILLHEQIHFDICELYVRKIKQHILNLNFENLDSERISAIIMQYEKEEEKCNLFFDSCVINEDKQELSKNVLIKSNKINKEWHAKLQKQLQELDIYKQPNGVIYRKKGERKIKVK